MQTKYIFDSKRSLKLFFVFIYIYLSILSTVVYSQYNAHSFKIKSLKPSVLYVFIFIIYFKQLIYCSIKKASSIGSGTGIVLKVSVMYRYRIKTKRYPSLLTTIQVQTPPLS